MAPCGDGIGRWGDGKALWDGGTFAGPDGGTVGRGGTPPILSSGSRGAGLPGAGTERRGVPSPGADPSLGVLVTFGGAGVRFGGGTICGAGAEDLIIPTKKASPATTKSAAPPTRR
jgi:hypothetical protein